MKVSDKLTKVNDSFTINLYDNGFMVEIGGRNSEDEWITAKIMCPDLTDVLTLVKEISEMDRND